MTGVQFLVHPCGLKLNRPVDKPEIPKKKFIHRICVLFFFSFTTNSLFLTLKGWLGIVMVLIGYILMNAYNLNFNLSSSGKQISALSSDNILTFSVPGK